MENTNDEFNFNVNTIIIYIKDNFIQFLMLILVVVIVYVIDHISNINAALYGTSSIIPGVPPPLIIKKREKNKK
jgi:hypothetical protein